MQEELEKPQLSHVRWIQLPSQVDPRGILTSVESRIDIPFDVKRIFYMHHIASPRGGHAHKDTDQVVIAISGCFKIELSDSRNSKSYEMKDPTQGLYVPRMIFIRLFDFSREATCLVLASTHYHISRSTRNWEDYLKEIRQRNPSRESTG